MEMDRLLIETAGLADILVRVADDAASLSSSERARYLAYEHIFYDSWELAWVSHAEGILEDRAFADWNSWFAEEARRKPPLGWTGNRRNHGDDFIRYVETQIAGD